MASDYSLARLNFSMDDGMAARMTSQDIQAAFNDCPWFLSVAPSTLSLLLMSTLQNQQGGGAALPPTHGQSQ